MNTNEVLSEDFGNERVLFQPDITYTIPSGEITLLPHSLPLNSGILSATWAHSPGKNEESSLCVENGGVKYTFNSTYSYVSFWFAISRGGTGRPYDSYSIRFYDAQETLLHTTIAQAQESISYHPISFSGKGIKSVRIQLGDEDVGGYQITTAADFFQFRV